MPLKHHVKLTSELKSVTAFLIFLIISSGLSLIHILLLGSGSDFDIFFNGSLRLRNLAYSVPKIEVINFYYKKINHNTSKYCMWYWKSVSKSFIKHSC